MKQLQECIKATWIFFIVRAVASLLVGFIYIVFAAFVQYVFVALLGETTFNYIIGGALSLYLSAVLCSYIGRILFMFIRGWHMAAIAYASEINSRNLPALDVGMAVFKKHFSSFAVVYGASVLIKKFASKGVEEIWALLADVPYVCSFARLAKFPIVIHLGKDLLYTAFDALVYYVVRYTKPGLSDDLSVFSKALRRYLYSLPALLLSSLSLYFLCSLLPLILYAFTFFALFWFNGIVAGILLNVLVYPVYYIVRHSIFEPLETICFMSCFARQCETDLPAEGNNIINRIFEVSGLSEYFNEEQSSASQQDGMRSAGATSDSDEVAGQETASIPESESSEVTEEDLNIDVEPDLEGGSLNTGESTGDDTTSPANLFNIIRNSADTVRSEIHMGEEEDETLEIEDDAIPPVKRAESMLNSLSPDLMQQAWNMVTFDEDNPSGSNSIGGDDFDFS